MARGGSASNGTTGRRARRRANGANDDDFDDASILPAPTRLVHNRGANGVAGPTSALTSFLRVSRALSASASKRVTGLRQYGPLTPCLVVPPVPSGTRHPTSRYSRLQRQHRRARWRPQRQRRSDRRRRSSTWIVSCLREPSDVRCACGGG